MSYPAISLATATVRRHRCPQKRLQTARQPPVYPNSSPDHRACNSLTPFRCPHAVHPCPSVDSGLGTTYGAWHSLEVGIARHCSIPGTMLVRMDALTTVKRCVALAVMNRDCPSKILLVQRPEDDQEFPGTWGLPAASLRPEETPERAARRIGTQKLGTKIRLGTMVACGRQQRAQYTLEMSLYEAKVDRSPLSLPTGPGRGPKVTLYTGWRWGVSQDLTGSALRGSLCSQLLLEWLGELKPDSDDCFDE